MATPSTDLLGLLFTVAPGPLLVVDQRGDVVVANEHAARLFGWTPDELAGVPVELVVPDAAVLRDAARPAGDDPDPAATPLGTARLAGRRRDGSTFLADISLTTLPGGVHGAAATDDPDGGLVIASVRPAPDRLDADGPLSRTTAPPAERSHHLESLGMLAGSIAHDFNNLLGVILNYTTLVARRVDDPEILDDIHEIKAAAERAAGLTRQIVSFASGEVADPEPLEINAAVEGIAGLLARSLRPRIELQLDLWPDPLVAVADRPQLEQVVVNLVLNARDAMPGGGTIVIATSPADGGNGDTDAPALSRRVVLTVGDSGVGISAEVMARAFEPFFTTKPPGEGTGLGLATVEEIVRRAGGDVAIRSQPGTGTAVTVALRGDERLPAVAERRVAPPVGGGDERILLAEADDALRRATARLLADSGYDVLVAGDGEAALDLVLRDDSIDLVIVDVAMPRLRGDEVARLLGEVRPDLPVLLISGLDGAEAHGGTYRLLTKPFADAVLLGAIREVLDDR